MKKMILSVIFLFVVSGLFSWDLNQSANHIKTNYPDLYTIIETRAKKTAEEIGKGDDFVGWEVNRQSEALLEMAGYLTSDPRKAVLYVMERCDSSEIVFRQALEKDGVSGLLFLPTDWELARRAYLRNINGY